ncbi:hypothetical protein FRC00_001035 [Tulasnella sp. 408]|nr:hypothetical protein FRC00_001035 [Tulasnella sp. 408]
MLLRRSFKTGVMASNKSTAPNHYHGLATEDSVVPNFQELGFQLSDLLFTIDVYTENQSVPIVEIKKPSNLRYISKREDADLQLRRFPIQPPPTPRDPEYVNDVALEDRWNEDVLEAGVEEKLRQTVQERFDEGQTL